MFENDSPEKEIQTEIIGSNVDLDQLEKDAEEKSFPYLMFMLAWIKDSLDAVSFGLLSLITTPFFFLTFLLWFWGRGFLIRKLLWKRVFKKVFTTAFVMAIPFLNIAPVTMLLVVVVHNQENKIVKVMEAMLTGEYEQIGQTIRGINHIAYGTR